MFTGSMYYNSLQPEALYLVPSGLIFIFRITQAFAVRYAHATTWAVLFVVLRTLGIYLSANGTTYYSPGRSASEAST